PWGEAIVRRSASGVGKGGEALARVRHEPAAGRRLHFVDGEEAPFARHALQFTGTAIAERDAGTDDEVLDGARNEDLVRARERSDSGADVYSHAAYVVAHELALAGVEA